MINLRILPASQGANVRRTTIPAPRQDAMLTGRGVVLKI